uniref:Uncharacterized protein n=1 Tax=Pyrodinium bahamense TaxID=73915 RepID=A0A7S0A8L4_9DINO
MAAFALPLLLALLSRELFSSALPRCDAEERDTAAVSPPASGRSLLQAQAAVWGGAPVAEDPLAAPTALGSGGGTASACTRVAWLHIPKCGTSFGTSLFHCANVSLPEEAHIPAQGTVEGYLVPSFLTQYPLDLWFQGRFWTKGGNVGSHTEIKEDVWRSFKGHFFAMFRKPSARAYSSWKFFGGTHCTRQGIYSANYAQRILGLATKMVAGQANGRDCSRCDTPCEKLQPDVDLALSRLGGFRFVGLTEEWALSVCLFHAMTGSECFPSEFLNVRPTHYSKSAEPDDEKRFFDGYHDPYDEALYERASAIFWANVAKHNVTRERCRHTCSRVQHIFSPEGALLSFDVD